MSTLQIDPDLAAKLDCEVGDIETLTITGRVTSKTPEGAVTLDVTDLNYAEAEAYEEPEAMPTEEERPMKRSKPSAVMVMIGKK